MAVVFGILYKKNDGSGTELDCEDGSKHVVDEITLVGQNWGETPQNWSRDGYTFEHWNTAADDSGTSYNGGDLYTGASVTLYAIWQADTPVGADVSVTLGNTEIASLSDTGSVTLATAGTYVNEDITIDYTKSGGGVDTVADFIENHGTLSSFEHSTITTIGDGAFCYCASLTTASFPACKSIGRNAFSFCTKLTTISFPICETIGASAFYSCTSLTTASFPACSSIGTYAFYSCRNLTTASFPICETIGACAFSSCTKLTTISFPICETIGASAFYSCASLTTASFPECSSIGTYAFYSCANLTTASFPICETIGTYAFYSCRNLTTASFPACSYISGSAFGKCFKLTSLYLLGSSVVRLSYSNAFTSTPIAGYTTSTGGVLGSIYVPSSLYSSYISATNWTYFSSRFVSV